MSRLAFRASLETPRPRSALLLVVLASLTLAISGQVHPAILLLQTMALLTALAYRHAPRPWQLRGAWLNAGLAGSALLALADLARGVPSTVALAQFALLASGLQLLDARPRRSEFLLVALALFQVVLASSLTDSLFFPPLLMAFLPTCVWTLLVHTLRSEALEAGDPAAATDAITPGLLGMTLAASAVSLALALCLFFLLPRLHEGLMRAGTGTPQATGGFSDRVDLGDLGRIRGDPTVVLRVETLSGSPPSPDDAYWRGLAFDRFDGRGWSVSAPGRLRLDGDPMSGVPLTLRRSEPDLVQRILREPVASGVLFGAGDPVLLQGATGRVERDANGSLYAPQSADARLRYEIAVRSVRPDADALSFDDASPPDRGERFLALPELAPEIATLAQEIVAGSTTDYASVYALERWLRSHGRYSDTPPPASAGDSRSPLERFLLGELEGHCEYFASAMVVLARSVGLPARLVNGFAGGHRNEVGDFVELTGSDAHAWVEIHFRDHGWVRFDPTPPDLRLAGARTTLSLRDRLAQLRSALELFWFQHVVEFDRTQQVGAAVGGWRSLRDWLSREQTGSDALGSRDWLGRVRELPAGPGLAIGGVLVLAGLLYAGMRRRRRPTPLPRAYARALRLLGRRGLVRPPGSTPRAFAREIGARLPPAGASAFMTLTEAYLRERYGRRRTSSLDAELRALRDSLRG